MSPTANHSDLIWKAVVSGVAVRVEIPPEVFQGSTDLIFRSGRKCDKIRKKGERA